MARPRLSGAVLLVVALVLVVAEPGIASKPEPISTLSRLPPLLDCGTAPVAPAGESDGEFRANVLSLLRVIPSAAAPAGFAAAPRPCLRARALLRRCIKPLLLHRLPRVPVRRREGRHQRLRRQPPRRRVARGVLPGLRGHRRHVGPRGRVLGLVLRRPQHDGCDAGGWRVRGRPHGAGLRSVLRRRRACGDGAAVAGEDAGRGGDRGRLQLLPARPDIRSADHNNGYSTLSPFFIDAVDYGLSIGNCDRTAPLDRTRYPTADTMNGAKSHVEDFWAMQFEHWCRVPKISCWFDISIIIMLL